MKVSESTFSPESVRLLLNSTWKRIGRTRLWTIALTLGGSIGLLIFFFSVLEFNLWMSPGSKVSLWAIATILLVLLGLWLSRYLKHNSFKNTIWQFSDAYNQAPVRYLIDLNEVPVEEQSVYHKAAIRQNLELISCEKLSHDLKKYVNGHPFSAAQRSAGVLFGAGVVLAGLMSAFQPGAVTRVLLAGTPFERPNPFEFVLTPGNNVIEQGTDAEILIQFTDDVPDQVVLALKTDTEDAFREVRMEFVSDGSFRSVIPLVFDDFDYRVQMDGYSSETYRMDVQLLPRFGSLVLTVVPPPHTGLDPEEIRYPFTRVEAYPGSTIEILGRTNAPVDEIVLRSRDSASIELGSGADVEFRGEIGVMGVDSLWFEMKDVNGLANRNTFAFTIEPLVDEFPRATLIDPAGDVSILEPTVIPVTYQLSDDFGFSRATLRYEIERSFGSNRTQSGSVRLAVPGERAAVDQLDWDVSGFGLFPMDVIRFWIEVADNDRPGGFKTAQSATVTIRISSVTDALLAQEEQEQDLADALESFQEAYDQNRQDLERLRQQLTEQQQNPIEQSREAEAIREQREQLSQQLEQLQEQFEQLGEEVKSGPELSEETQRMYEELQQLMQEIDDPEILEALKALQEGLQNADQNMIREALEQVDFNEERFQERLNRTAELFKSLQMNAELDRMSSILEDLAAREEALIGDELPELEEQLDRQRQIQNELNSLPERLDRLQERGPQRARETLENLREQTNEGLRNAGERLEQDINELQEQSGQQSSEQQNGQQQDSSPQRQQRRQEIRDQLQQMQESMEQTKAMMNQQRVQVNIQALLGIMQHLLLLSDAQETVVTRTGDAIQGSAAFIDLARSQRNITSNFSQITDSLYRVSAEIPSFPNRVNSRKVEVLKNLENTVQWMAERDRNRATAESRIALGGINEIASMLADLLEAIQNQDGSGSGSGGMSAEQMMEQLQNISGNQQQLNQQIQDMINDLQGERLLQGQMERLDQMARQQNDIRRQLQQLQQGGGLGSGDQLMSELQRLSEEMEDAINDLRGGVIDRTLISRQQNILSRMLQAERALNEREEDEERRGSTPDAIDRLSPSELTLEALREQIRRGLQENRGTRFSEEYQRLIQRYFELLERADER